MPNWSRKRKNNDGSYSYSFRVYHGYDADGERLKPYTKTWRSPVTMTERQADKAAQREFVAFEEQCKQGYAPDNRQTFAQYAAYVMECKAEAGTKRRTLERYKSLLTRIYAGIGHIKLVELRPQHLSAFYSQLRKAGIRSGTEKAKAAQDFRHVMQNANQTRQALAERSGVSPATITSLCKGNAITADNAQKLADALGQPLRTVFTVTKDTSPLSEKTVLEHHRLISSILAQAEKEMLVPYNAAEKIVNKPKAARSREVNYFQPEQLEQIRDALETEPLKWQVITHLLLVTGCRRGEIMGLKWHAIDFRTGTIHIENNLLYSGELGVYEDTTKTETSTRAIRIPDETVQLLKRYHIEWEQLRRTYGTAWNSFLQLPNGRGEMRSQRADFLFIREDGDRIGYPMSPDSATQWLSGFSKRHGLPHINPHAFRHTLASVLCMQHVDMTTISKWLGHKNVTTTLNIYEHILEQGKEQVVACVSDVILKPRNAKGKQAQ